MVTLAFVGDIRMKAFQDRILSDEVKAWLMTHDLRVCNVEAPFESDGKPIPKIGPHLKQPTDVSTVLKAEGFNVFSLANNHIFDYGEQGLKQTLTALGEGACVGAGLTHQKAYALLTRTINDIRVGVLSCAEYGFGVSVNDNQPGFAWINHDHFDTYIENARQQVDVLILYVHAGVEHTKWPLPQWRKRYKQIIDLGVDAVIASHPHVPQGMELYKNKPIYYSLGNFYFDYASTDPLWDFSVGVSLKINRSPEGIHITNHPLFFQKKDTVQTVKDFPQDWTFEELCTGISHTQKYSDYIQTMVVQLWETIYSSFYQHIFFSFHNSPLGKSMKNLVKLMSSHTLDLDEMLLAHNMLIESHKWVVELYLVQIQNKSC